jgi:rubredoxin
MPYTELIKSFNRTRAYMRELFVFGFRSREEVGKKSARSYDDERRRVESRLGEHMQFRRLPDDWRCPRCKRKKEKFTAA